MSDNIKKINLSTPGRILDAGDIRRKKDKLDKTLGQLENLQEGSKKYHRKMFKAEKTLDQLQSGRAGIQSFKMPYNMVKNNSAIKEVTTEEVRRVPEYPPVRELQKRFEKPTIVDDTYARNIQRNIEKHKRQDAMIEADRARELERQLLEREVFNLDKYNDYPRRTIVQNNPSYEMVEPGKYKVTDNFTRLEKPNIDASNLENMRLLEETRREMAEWAKTQRAQNDIIKRNSATPYKLPHQNNAALKQTVSSSGGDNRLDEFLSRVESRRIKNPEYADQEGPEYSRSYDFFITNRSPESDKVAIKMDSLNQVIKEQAANRQFDEMRKSREYQQNLMNQYNLD